MPLISTGSTHPETTNGKRYVFRIPFTDALQGRALATLARGDLKADTAAMMHDASDPYATELTNIFARVFEEVGGRIVASETYTPDAKVDYSAQIRRIREHQPDVLLLPNRLDDTRVQVRQARAHGITATVLGSDNWRPEDVTSELDGAYFTAPERLHERRLAALAAAFGRAYDAPPGVEAVETYDAFGLIFAAIRFSGDTTPDAIRDGLYRMGPYEGVTGDIDYVNDGSPPRSVMVLHVAQRESRLASRAARRAVAMIRRWWRTSVQFRLVSFFLLLSWSSVVTVGTLAFVRARQELSGAALTRLEASAALKGDELRRWLDGQRRDLLVLAAWPDLKRTAAAALACVHTR